MTFSEKLLAEANKYLKIQLKKKFLVQISDGTLETERFNFWIRADYPYLMNMASYFNR